MALGKVLHGMAVYVNGVSHVGVATSMTPPDVEPETVEQRQPGHGGVIRVPTGRLMPMEAMFTMSDVVPELEVLAADPKSVDVPVTFISALTDGGEDARRDEYEIKGLWTKQSPGERSMEGRAGGGAATYTISVRELTHLVDGVERRHVDLESDIHRIDGRDVNQPLREALQA